jgi:hypothetical protein
VYHSASFEVTYSGLIRQAIVVSGDLTTFDSLILHPAGMNGLLVDVDLLVGTI